MNFYEQYCHPDHLENQQNFLIDYPPELIEDEEHWESQFFYEWHKIYLIETFFGSSDLVMLNSVLNS